MKIDRKKDCPDLYRPGTREFVAHHTSTTFASPRGGETSWGQVRPVIALSVIAPPEVVRERLWIELLLVAPPVVVAGVEVVGVRICHACCDGLWLGSASSSGDCDPEVRPAGRSDGLVEQCPDVSCSGDAGGVGRSNDAVDAVGVEGRRQDGSAEAF